MKKLEGSIDVSLINETFFPEYEDASVINMGECFAWAYISYCLYRNVELWDFSAHAFVKDKATGRFYDSETYAGTFHWWQLPATNSGMGCGCTDCKVSAKKVRTAGQFRRYWSAMQRQYNIDYYVLHNQIERVIGENS
jgi:hypothetical protein